MVADFDDRALFEDDDLVRYGRAGQTVRNENSGLVLAETVELVVDFLFRDGVKAGGRFVEDDDVGIAVERTRDGQLLPLTDRQFDAVFFKVAHERGIVFVGQVVDEFVRRRLFRREDNVFFGSFAFELTELDVFTNVHGVFSEVLEDDAEHGVQVFDGIFADVVTVEENLTFRGVIQTGEQLDECGFARTVQPDENAGVPRFQREADIIDDLALGSRINERNMTEFDRMTGVVFDAAGFGKGRNNGRLFVHERNQVVDEQRTFVNGRGGVDERADAARNGGQRAGIEGVVTDFVAAFADPFGDVQEEQTVDGRRDDSHAHVQETFFHEQLFQPAEIDLERIVVTPDEEIGQAEQTDFLDHVLVGHEVGVVVHLAAFLGVPAHIPEVLFAVAEVDDRRRNAHGNDNQRSPRADADERDHEGNHADDGTDDREVGVENMDRTAAGFPFGVFKLFVEFRQVEAGKVNFARLVHDFEVDVIDDKFAGNVVEDVADAVDESGDEVVGEPDNQDFHDEVEFVRAGSGCGGDECGSEGVEQVCADFRADDGGHTVEDRHEYHVEQNPRTGVPYETENIKQTMEKFRDYPIQIIGNFLDGFRFRFLHGFHQFFTASHELSAAGSAFRSSRSHKNTSILK